MSGTPALPAGFNYVGVNETISSVLNGTTPEPSEAPGADADVSVVVVGLLTFVMITFYLVKSPAQLVVDNTWALLSSGVSIFCAVLVNDIINKYLNMIFQMPSGDDPTPAAILSAGIQWFVWWMVVVVSLSHMSSTLLHLKAYGTIFGHILGFAGINLYGLICLSPPFSNNPWMILIVYVIFVVSFFTLFAIGKLIRTCHCHSKNISKEDMDRWHEQTVDTGTDFFCMTGSFILSFWIRYLIINPDIPSIDGSEDGRSATQAYILEGIGLVLIVIAGAFAWARHKFDFPDVLGDMIGTTISLLAAWLFLFGINWWIFNYGGASVLNRFFVAAIFSIEAIVFIIASAGLIDHCGADKYLLKGIFTAVSLTVGMGWEKTFDACMDGLGDYLNDSSPSEGNLNLLVYPAVLFLVFPAWVVYILTKTDDELKKLPPQSCCVACPCVSPDWFADDEEDLEDYDGARPLPDGGDALMGSASQS